MNVKTTHSPFFPTLARYAKALRKDVSFTMSAKMLLRILLLAVGFFLLLGIAGREWADVYDATDKATQTWKEFLFGVLGSIDAKPEAGAGSVLYSAIVRLLGALLIGGVITSFLCALAERLAEMKLRGLLVPVLRDHFVVMGHGPMTDELIRTLLAPPAGEDLAHWTPQERTGAEAHARDVSRRKVLLCTGDDVETTREALNAVLPPDLAARVVYAFGKMDLGNTESRDAVCGRLCLQDARQIYILGDSSAATAGDVENLVFARGVGDYLATHAPRHPDGLPKPVFVRLDAGASFDLVKKLSFATDAAAEKTDGGMTSYFKPFSFTEGWARRLWGGAMVGSATGGDALDFAPMGRDSRVHLVVAGFTPLGEALVLEAVRVCHFPNGQRTRITVVDPDSVVEASFLSRHPWLKETLTDVEIEFLPCRIESPDARDLLRDSACDEEVLLSVAICFRHVDSALSAALNLPEEVYRHRLPAQQKTIRDRYREHGARIWVAQEHRNGLAERAEGLPRYGNLRPFGMQEGGFEPRCLREFSAMYLNAVYDWPLDDRGFWIDGCKIPEVADRIAAFRSKWKDRLADRNVFAIDATEKKDLLVAILAAGGDAEVRRFQEYAFRKYIRLLKPHLRWANVYVSDLYGAVFRSLGLRAVQATGEPAGTLAVENDRAFAEARDAARFERGLDETEHNRWLADRALMGYRAPRPGTGEWRDDDFRYHPDMIPFRELPPDEKGKDELSVCSIPLFMALEGMRLEHGRDATDT